MEIMHRVDLGCRRVGPTEAKRLQALFQLAEHEDGLFVHGVGARLTGPDRAFAIARMTFHGLTAAGDDKGRRSAVGEGE